MISTHFRRRVHSQLDDIPWLKDVEAQALWLNPVDAEPRGIKNGEQVKVSNELGVAIIPAWVTERIMPGVVHLAAGGNLELDENGVDRGGCPNVFTSADPSPAGAFALNSVTVQVQKA